MKKGLLSILAGALVLVGCQNYDDQFDNLESQISALASTVAGLSQVQSDLSSLAGTVSSLATTVNGLGDQIDTAVSDGLSDIQSDIEAIETAVADVASSEEVSALQDAVDASQEDLDDLLASSSVFTGDVVVNSISTLDAFHAMGAGLAIVNGSVNIDIDAEMDAVKAQELINNIKTVTEDFDYAAATSSIAEMTFNELTGVQSLTLKQAGSYKAQALKTATIITLNQAFESKITVIDFRALTSVTKFVSGSTDNSIDFNQADEVHLTVLPRYNPGTLTINMDEGGALPIAELDDVDGNGDQADLTLDITGPASVTLTKITDGAITLTDVETASITDFTGQLTINGGVETLTVVDGVKVSVASATDLVTANIDLKLDDDTDLTTAQTAALDYGSNGNLDFTGLTDLTDVTISGQVNDITLSGNSNLETVVISAKSDDLTISGAGDLTSVTVTGAEFNDVSITNNTDLEALTLDHTTRLTKTGTAATAVEKGASLTVTGNSKLASLVSSADHIDALTIQNNAKLTSIDFTGLADGGTSTTATVLIGGSTATRNNLSATLITDAYDTAPATLNTGSITSDSGIETLQTYLDVVAAKPSSSGVKVYLDEADSFIAKGATTAADVETSSLVIGASAAVTAKLAVVNIDVSNAVAAPGNIAAVNSVYVPNGAGAGVSVGAKNIAATSLGTIGNNARIQAAAWVTDALVASYSADGITLSYVAAGAAVDGGTASSTFKVQAAEADGMTIVYGESIKIGVGSNIITVPIKDTDTTLAGVQIAGVTVTFDVNSAVAGQQTAVNPVATGYAAATDGTAFVTSMTELTAAMVAYLNEADWSTPDYDAIADTDTGYDLGNWLVTANATTDLDFDVQITGVGTKAWNGAILADHLDGTSGTEITINTYDDGTTSDATLVDPAGVIFRFTADQAGRAYNFTLSVTDASATASSTLINSMTVRQGADGKMYGGAKSADEEQYDNYRMYVAGGSTAAAATASLTFADDDADLKNEAAASVDDYTAADFMEPANAGDATANSANDVDRTGWLGS